MVGISKVPFQRVHNPYASRTTAYPGSRLIIAGQMDSILCVDTWKQVADIIKRAALPAEAVHFPIGVLEQEVGEVRAHHASDSGDRGSRLGLRCGHKIAFRRAPGAAGCKNAKL